ncbi:MAG TPA: polysaccharide deacetylase family protein [Actinomycetota bacterium]
MRRSVAAVATVVLVVLGSPTAIASLAVAVRIVAPSDGSTVSGAVLVEADTTGVVTLVEFEWSRDAGGTWEPIGVDSEGPDRWSATWETPDFSGAALVRATATGGAEVASDTVAVTVDNVAPVVDVDASPSPFSPNGDGRRDVVVLRVDAGEPAEVTLRIVGPEGAVARAWTGRGESAYTWEWGGRGGTGPVPDGRYLAEASAEDAAGFRATASAPLVVDTAAPRVRFTRPGSDRIRAPRPVTLGIRVRDRSATGSVTVSLSDAVEELWREEAEAGQEETRIRWSARYPNGDPLFPGPYRAEATARDEAGNVGAAERVFRVEGRVPARVFRRVEGTGPRVALTFDDCHYASAWARILDVLEGRGVRATFFCPGRLVASNVDLARRTVADGHAAGAHGWDHANLAGRAESETERRLRADDRAWWRVAGSTGSPFFRPPYGAYDRAVLAAAGATSHPRVVLWDVDTEDYRRPGAGAIAARAVSGARPGSIILMHTLDETAAALPSILAGLRRKGLEPVTLPELFRAGGLR